MTTTLTKTFGQYKQGGGLKEMESDLNIEVSYDPQEDSIEKIEKIWVYNYDLRCATDVTSIFMEDMGSVGSDLIQSIDWREIYQERKELVEG